MLPASWHYGLQPLRILCSLVRSALLCDGVEEAKRLAFMGPERHKVVALDGTLLSKSGFMTGGLTGSEADRAQRFDEHRSAALKQVRADNCCKSGAPLRHPLLVRAWDRGKITGW